MDLQHFLAAKAVLLLPENKQHRMIQPTLPCTNLAIIYQYNYFNLRDVMSWQIFPRWPILMQSPMPMDFSLVCNRQHNTLTNMGRIFISNMPEADQKVLRSEFMAFHDSILAAKPDEFLFRLHAAVTWSKDICQFVDTLQPPMGAKFSFLYELDAAFEPRGNLEL